MSVRAIASLLLAALLVLPAAAQDRPPPPPPPRGSPPPPGTPPPRFPPPPRTAPAPRTGAIATAPTPPGSTRADAVVAELETDLVAARARGDAGDVGAAMLALAAEYARQQRPERALSLLEQAAALADRVPDHRLGREAALEAARIHADAGNTVQATLWRDRADAYRQRIASEGGRAAAAVRPPTGDVAPVASDAAAPSPAAMPPPDGAGTGDRSRLWALILLPLTLLVLWGWVRTQRNAERLQEEAARLARHKRQLSTANTALQEQASRLREQAVHDPLTGAMTRAAFARRLDEVLLHASHYGKPVALLVFDLDHFKQINDGHGHLAGDAALRLVAGLVRECLGSDDLFGRFGGDEFLIACGDCDGPAALRIAETLRGAVAARAPAENAAFAGLSLSVGLAIADAGSGWHNEPLFHRADAALYAAKRAGRNRCVLADADTPSPPLDAHVPRTLGA